MALRSLNEFIDQLSSADTVQSVHAVCAKLCDQFGFDHFHYGARFPTSFTQPYFIDVSSYPSEWWQRYKDQGYLAVDPAVAHCASNVMPITWDKVAPSSGQDKLQWQIMDEAQGFGLKGGLSIPLHSPQGEAAMLSFTSARDDVYVAKCCQQVLPEALLFTVHLHETMRRLFTNESLALMRVDLTPREQECLLWAAEGKTTWETGQILKISERTVVFHVTNAASKLNVVNRQQAVARAVAAGLISPQMN